MALTQISTQGIKDGTITGTDLATNVNLIDNQKLRLGTGNDLQIYHDGSNSYLTNTTGELRITDSGLIRVNTDDFRIYKGDGNELTFRAQGDGAVTLFHNNSAKFETTSTGVSVTGQLSTTDTISTVGNLDMSDSTSTGNNRIMLGTGDDLQIYHDGSHSYITNATNDLRILANEVIFNNANNTENKAKFINNGAVELYYDNSKKFETMSTGVDVHGTLRADEIKLQGDNQILKIGGADDLQLYHSGQNSIITNNVGDLRLESDVIELNNQDSNEFYLRASNGGAVELYHDNSKKFETTSSGVEISSALGIANVGGSIAGSGGGQDYFGIRDSAGAFALMVKTHGTSNGSVGIGTTSPNVSGFNSDANVLTLSGPKRGFIELRGNTQAADSIGGIRFFSANNLEAEILSVTDSSFNGDLRFTTNGSERMRINSSGRVGITNTSPDATLHIKSPDGGNNRLILEHENDSANEQNQISFLNDGTQTAFIKSGKDSSNNNFGIIFGTGTAEKVRITGDSTPTLLIGQTSVGADANGWTLRGAIQTSSVKFTSTDVRTMFFMSSYHSTGSQDTKFAFHSNGTLNATNTTIQAFSSERRTKKNIVALNLEKAWNTLRDTPFYTFNYKNELEGAGLHHGPIVDECPEDLIVPTQKEDEVGIINTVNTEKLQYRAYSALQQAIKKIEVLETEVAALKAS